MSQLLLMLATNRAYIGICFVQKQV